MGTTKKTFLSLTNKINIIILSSADGMTIIIPSSADGINEQQK